MLATTDVTASIHTRARGVAHYWFEADCAVVSVRVFTALGEDDFAQ